MTCTFASPSGPSCGRVVCTILEDSRSTAPMGTGSRKVIWSRAKNRKGPWAKREAFVKQSSLLPISRIALQRINLTETHNAYEL